MHDYDDKDDVYYNPLQFVNPNALLLIDKLELNKISASDSMVF